MISRITCTHNLTVELMIRVYALINHMNIHENLNMLWYIGAKVLWCSELSEVSHAWLHKHAFDLDDEHDMFDKHV